MPWIILLLVGGFVVYEQQRAAAAASKEGAKGGKRFGAETPGGTYVVFGKPSNVPEMTACPPGALPLHADVLEPEGLPAPLDVLVPQAIAKATDPRLLEELAAKLAECGYSRAAARVQTRAETIRTTIEGLATTPAARVAETLASGSASFASESFPTSESVVLAPATVDVTPPPGSPMPPRWVTRPEEIPVFASLSTPWNVSGKQAYETSLDRAALEGMALLFESTKPGESGLKAWTDAAALLRKRARAIPLTAIFPV